MAKELYICTTDINYSNSFDIRFERGFTYKAISHIPATTDSEELIVMLDKNRRKQRFPKRKHQMYFMPKQCNWTNLQQRKV